MNSTKIIVVILVTLGIALLAYSGITFRAIESPVVIFPVHVETVHSLFNPLVAGVVALVGGVILLVGEKHKGLRKVE
ncbi:MAG: hypothetical protein WCI95_10720 [bacterium]